MRDLVRPVQGSGDLTLTARAASPEVFRPFGTLVRASESASLAAGAAVLMSLRALTPGPRRVTHLDCYPDARRVVMAMRDVPLWMVVVSAGQESAPAAAFTIPPDHAVVLSAGIWHAGPWPLSDTTVCELLETPDAVDRLDRKRVSDIAGVDGIRVVLPEEPGARVRALDLSDPTSLRTEGDIVERVNVAVLMLEGLDQEAARSELEEESARVTEGLRALWGHTHNVSDIPGVQSAREHLQSLGLVSERNAWPDEGLLRDVLQGAVPQWRVGLEAVRALCFLRMRVPLVMLDGDKVRSRLTVRPASADLAGPAGVEPGAPVVCDAEGVVATPVSVTERVAPSAKTRRVIAMLWLPPGLEAAAIEALVNGVAGAVRTHCGGRLVGRRVLAV